MIKSIIPLTVATFIVLLAPAGDHVIVQAALVNVKDHCGYLFAHLGIRHFPIAAGEIFPVDIIIKRDVIRRSIAGNNCEK